jgi:hypothetical protein
MDDHRLFQIGRGGRVWSTYGVVVVVMLISAVMLRVASASMMVVGLVLFVEVIILPVMGLSGRIGGPPRVVLTHLGMLLGLGILAGILGTWATEGQV